jgi:hypothetical protein
MHGDEFGEFCSDMCLESMFKLYGESRKRVWMRSWKLLMTVEIPQEFAYTPFCFLWIYTAHTRLSEF